MKNIKTMENNISIYWLYLHLYHFWECGDKIFFDVMKYVLIWSYIFYHSKLLEAITLSFIIFRKHLSLGKHNVGSNTDGS